MYHIILHKNDNGSALHSLMNECPFISDELIKIITDSHLQIFDKSNALFSIDQSIAENRSLDAYNIISENIPLKLNNFPLKDDRVIIANARYKPDFNLNLIHRVFEKADADIISIEIDHNLCGYREKITFDSNDNIAGLRRVFSDNVFASSLPKDWPEYVIISRNAIERERGIKKLPADFGEFVSKCRRKSLTIRNLRVAGTSHDLYDTGEILNLIESNLNEKRDSNSSIIPESASIIGKVIIGKNTIIEDNAILVGPCIIGSNCNIKANTVIRNAIVGDNLTCSGTIEHAFLSAENGQEKFRTNYEPKLKVNHPLYKTWPSLTYAGIWKRIVDIIFSLCILTASIPIFIIVAIAIKYASPGPVFFRHKRQGLHGKEFGCIKFRTMIVGADDIQDQLRKINEVDGPQFKMDDDPRVNSIGKFLRDTCIDEIPQFINVLLGQMSVIGPRPSPEKENSFCAYWRDARLSVRPGITGLWQVMRTRQEGQDFQEWVIHDTSYVKNISIGSDIKICLMTVKHILKSFIEQF